jgi:quercetin 2,3-dioxygenase
MNVLRRNTTRRHIRSGTGEMWCTFYPSEDPDTSIDGFGVIVLLNEYMLPSNDKILTDLVHGTELLTYAYNGALALEGPEGHSGIITAGEFQYMTIFRGNRQRITNTSPTESASVFSLHLHMPPAHSQIDQINVQTRFTKAQRHNVLCTVASPDAGKESLLLKTNAHVYSSILDPGQHVVYELRQGRKVWLHIVYGKVTANKIDLAGGDGMGISGETAISLTARENTELLLIDTIEDYPDSHQKTA